MKQNPNIQNIEISNIVVNKQYSLHPFSQSFSQETQASIETIGIIHPPIVQKIDANFHLICGHKRVEHFQKNDQTTVPCLVLSETTPMSTLLNIVLTDQQLHASLSVVERAYFLKLCRNALSDEETITLFATNLPCRKHKSAINEGINILSTFDLPTLILIHNGIIAEQTATTILSIKQNDRQAIIHLMNELQPGGGKQKRIISLLRDICGREQVSISTYLQNERIQEILNHEEMNRPQKTQQITEYLQTAHAPQSTKAQSDFQELIQQLDMPEGTSLQHSPAFEKDEITLSLQFKDQKEFQAQWPKLKEYIVTQR